MKENMEGLNPELLAVYEVANEITDLLYKRCQEEGFNEAQGMTVMTGVVTRFFGCYGSKESASRRLQDLCYLAGKFINERFAQMN